jgi:hypothetical protein
MAFVLNRTIIRDTTVAILKAAATAAGDRVYPTAIVPWRRERPLPAIGVYTLGERSAPLNGGFSGPFQLRQSLELTIECLVELPTDATLTPDERLRLDTSAPIDALCGEVTRALLPNPLWYGAGKPEGFDGLEGWATRIELGRVEDTDRRTAAAIITATPSYMCVAEPTIDDRLEVVGFGVDMIDPAADPNTEGHPTTPPDGYPGGYPGPDGRIELEFVVPRPTDPPLWPVAEEELDHAG